MIKVRDLGLRPSPHIIKNEVIECAEQGRYCMKKFIRTRYGQTDTCIKCMEMLDDYIPPIIKCKNTKWKN